MTGRNLQLSGCQVAPIDERRLTTRSTRRTATSACILPLIVATIATFSVVALAVEPTTAPDNDQPAAATQPTQTPLVGDANINQGWPAPIDDGLLSLNLIVHTPDGKPAAESRVTSYSQLRSEIQKANTDSRGRVSIRGVFGHGVNLHARTADGKFQATLKIPASETRTKLSAPMVLTLQPAVEHQVSVMSEGMAVAGASVTVSGTCFEVSGTTEANGIVSLAVPVNERVERASAWHAERGVGGIWKHPDSPPELSTTLSLHPVAPISVRVVDDHNNAVPDLALCVTMFSFSDATAADERLVMAWSFPGAAIRTSVAGQSSFNEVPRGRTPYIHFESLDDGWKIDRIEQMTAANRTTTVYVRRLKVATGRVIMPPDVTASGLLISSNGFGPPGANYGHDLLSRARKDGSFQYRVSTAHGYCVAIMDHEWYSDLWTGLVLKSFDAEPSEIVLKAQRAVPIKVRVTQGPNHKPYPDAIVILRRDKSFRFSTEAGEIVNAMGSAMNWLEVDSNGEVRTGAPVGNIDVSAGVGLWRESKKIKVTADKPLEVEFHCAVPIIVRKSELTARMTRNGSPYKPSPSLKLYAWTDFPPSTIEQGNSTFSMQRASVTHRPTLRSDQSIAVTITDDDAKVLAIDEETKLAGFVKIQKDQPAGTIEMRPCASFQGTLLNENGEPLPKRELQNLIGGVAFVPIGPTVVTDAEGRFSLSAIPSELPIRMSLTNDETKEGNYRIFGDLLFEVGENRADAKVKAQRIADERAPRGRQAEKVDPVSQRLPQPLRDARVSGMHVLVLLQGDNSERTSKLTKQILADDDDEEDDEAADDELQTEKLNPVYYYLPMVVRKVSAKADLDFLKQHEWPRPKKNEIVLVALDASQALLGTKTLSVSESETSRKIAIEFLQQHKPAYEDAQTKLDAARTLAAKTNRRVWIVSCGPRCGPCFQLAHWLERQHELLEKDYVLVKLMGGLQANADKINDEIGGRQHGIPWFVITEPDGTILTTSESPTGNMGMPSSLEDIRHLRKMLEQTARHLTSDQIDQLAKSLEPQPEK